MFRHARRVALATAAVAALVLTPPSPAFAAGSAYAAWTEGRMSIPLTGFPGASIDTDATSTQIPSGASTWLGADTPFGQVFGSSRDKPYMNISTATGITPSTTTFTFDSPTPSGWGFSVGDIDADKVTISAWDADGAPLDKDALGHQREFNYCDGTDAPPCVNPGAMPTWDPVEGSLTGNGQDTNGASGWFQPTEQISRLEFYFESLVGFPIFQLWFAALSRDISGTVLLEDGSPPPPGSTLELVDPDGAVIDSTDPDADGNYQFTGVPSAAYTVRVTPPDGYSVVGEAELPADTTGGDVTDVDFVLQVTPPTTTTTTTSTTTTVLPPDGGGGGGGARNVPPASPPGGRLPDTGTATLVGALLGLFGLALGAVLIALSRREEQQANRPRHMT